MRSIVTVLVLLVSTGPLLSGASLPTLSEDQVEGVVAQHRGKVVVLNFWATWCGPCREEFPDLVKLYNENKDRLVLVSVSMDEPEDKAQVVAYLKQQKAEFPAYLRAFKDFQKFVNAVDPEWGGGIPATVIFDRTGKRIYGHEGKMTYAELKKIVDAQK